jgi:hypothetical protein
VPSEGSLHQPNSVVIGQHHSAEIALRRRDNMSRPHEWGRCTQGPRGHPVRHERRRRARSERSRAPCWSRRRRT